MQSIISNLSKTVKAQRVKEVVFMHLRLSAL
jgi:hypothetical protein